MTWTFVVVGHGSSLTLRFSRLLCLHASVSLSLPLCLWPAATCHIAAFHACSALNTSCAVTWRILFHACLPMPLCPSRPVAYLFLTICSGVHFSPAWHSYYLTAPAISSARLPPCAACARCSASLCLVFFIVSPFPRPSASQLPSTFALYGARAINKHGSQPGMGLRISSKRFLRNSKTFRLSPFTCLLHREQATLSIDISTAPLCKRRRRRASPIFTSGRSVPAFWGRHAGVP